MQIPTRAKLKPVNAVLKLIEANILNHEPKLTPVVSAFVSDVIFDGYNYAIQFNYFTGIGDVIKSVCKNAERRWYAHFFRDPNKQYFRYWMINKGVIDEQSQDLYNALKVGSAWSKPQDFNAFISMFEQAQSNSKPDAFIEDLKFSIYPLERGWF